MWAVPVVGQEDLDARFTRLGTTEGIAHDSVYDILQDRRGFLWFATEDGLTRYDGAEAVTLRHDPFDENSLAESDINDIIEDDSGTLWIGSWGGGLDRLDPETMEIRHFRHDPERSGGLSDNRVQSLLVDSRGVLWVGTYHGGLNRFYEEAGTFDHFRAREGDPRSLPDDHVWGIVEDDRGDLWIATGRGLCRLNPESGEFVRFRDGPAAGLVRVVETRRDGGIWIGTQQGVFRMSGVPGNRSWSPVEGTESLTCTTLLEDPQGRLWIGTRKHGLLLHDPRTGAVVRFEHRVSDPSSLSHDDIRALLIDHSKNLWVGTRGGGVDKLDLKSGKFPCVRMPGGEVFRESVWAFGVDAEDALWVGTSEGVFRFDGGSVRTFVYNPRDETTLSYQKVRSILCDEEGGVWIGTNGGGLNLFDPDRNSFRRYRHRPEDPDSLTSDNILVLVGSSEGTMWIGTDGGGLDRLDRATGRFTHFIHDPNDPSSLSDMTITAILETSTGALWVGTSEGGVNFRVPGGKTFRHYRKRGDGKTELTSDSILSLHESRDGTIWIGTHAGLNYFDPRSDTFGVLCRRDGLPSNVIYGILEDDEGMLWLTTNQGLARFDPGTRKCKTYGTDDGLQSLGFNEGAAFRAHDGTMYVGGINGFNSFRPDLVRDNPYPPTVVVTGLTIIDRKRGFEKMPWALDEVKLNWSDSGITFSFAALEFTAPRKNRFQYRMEGFDRQWIDAGTRRHATYTNLDPGSYIFRVRASNNDGLWSPEGATVRVIVEPAMWQTWWFRGLVGLVALITLVVFYRIRTQTIRSRNAELVLLAERRKEAEDKVRRYAEELEHSTLHDRLTGLPNRALFLDRVQVALDRSRRDQRRIFAVLVLDLDGFKLVNDSLGHAVGDELLKAFAFRAESFIRTEDSLARLGADEFALLLEDIGDATTLRRLLERIHRALDEPFLTGDHEIFVTVSIGVAVSSDTYWQPGEMLRDADTAMHRAKESGRGRHVIFNPEMHAESAAALETEGALRRAVDRNEFVLEYQPIVDLSDGRLAGFEALIRWRRPGHSLVYPGDFLSHARDAGFTTAIGSWVIRQACRQAGVWQKVSPNGRIPVSVNLFSRQVSDERLIDQITTSLLEASLDPDLLHLEITEDVLIDATTSATGVLSQLRSQGLKILLDDFGTGYSSLTYLQRFPVDALKIDRSFVGEMLMKRDSATIVESIVMLARSLGKEIIAEGVESLETLLRLRDLGCRFSQGFFFSRSLSGDAATLLVERGHRWRVNDLP